MGLIKRNPFGHILIIKKWLIRILGILSHRRYRGFNELQIEGSEIIKIYQKRMSCLFLITKLILQMWWQCFMFLMQV